MHRNIHQVNHLHLSLHPRTGKTKMTITSNNCFYLNRENNGQNCKLISTNKEDGKEIQKKGNFTTKPLKETSVNHFT